MLEGAGEMGALQTSSDGRGRYCGGNFRLLWCAVGGGGGYSNFREFFWVEGAGGPVALQTSPPVRSQKSVDTDPHAALAGLTCRASPANSSVAGGAALDSVRLRRNCSLLLCVSQSSSLTCARGAYRAWAREKAGVRGGIQAALGPARRPGCCGNSARGAYRAWAREKAGVLWKFCSRRLPRLGP